MKYILKKTCAEPNLLLSAILFSLFLLLSRFYLRNNFLLRRKNSVLTSVQFIYATFRKFSILRQKEVSRIFETPTWQL